MGNCTFCRLYNNGVKRHSNSRCVQTIASPFIQNNELSHRNSKNYTNSELSQPISDGNYFNDLFPSNSSICENSNNNFVIFSHNRNNNRNGSLTSSNQNVTNSNYDKLKKRYSTSIPKSTSTIHRTHTKKRNKHVFCDSSLETETNSNNSTKNDGDDTLNNFKINRLNKSSNSGNKNLFLISKIPPPSPLPIRRKMDSSHDVINSSSNSKASHSETKGVIEYTFYVDDRDKCRRPLLDKRVNSIISNYNCNLKLHGPITNSESSKVFYKGNPVIPVTIKSDNMASLRKCIGRLDNQFPYFNVKAFLNS